MNFISAISGQVLALTFVGLAFSGQLLAADQDKRNDDNHNDHSNSGKADRHDQFDISHREAVRNYYGKEMRQGRCPPGLAKKNNGCQPPGQAKRWQIGQHLQSNITYKVLPGDLQLLLGQPQTGYHYGMVDSDILLLLDGTEMVMDAINNLGQ